MVQDPAPGRDPEQVLAHDAFVRGLARQLLRDAHGAEDVAQQTWVAALQRPPAPASLRGWLAAVARRLASRRLRGERREQARQRSAARPELVPSAAAIVAREALRGEVVRAVLELDEPYRAVVLLRFFEQLPPRKIARRLQVPVETVRTRLRRALAQLRARLDHHSHGDRAAWCALLLPFAGKASPLAATAAALNATITGALLMTSKVKFAAFAAGLGGILLIALWQLTDTPPGRGEGTLAAPAASPQTAELPTHAADAAALATPAAAAEREALAPAAAPTTGSMLVHVVWGDDHQPAPGVIVEAYRNGSDELFENRRAASDAQGTVRFPDLTPGRVWAVVRRGDPDYGPDRKIVAGQELELTLEVAAGMNAKGIVVDGRDQPIAGADVLITGWTGGEMLALTQTAADGTFALRAVGTHCHIGACAKGHAPSAMRQFTASKGATVEFRIVLGEPGTALAGTVLDPRDRPVPGAVVQVGTPGQKTHTLADGAQAMGPQLQRVLTDAAGRFAFTSVETGAVPLAVRAPGLAPWLQQLDLQATRAEAVTVRLQPGVTLVGTVRDAAGAPVAKVEVEVGDWEDLGHRRVRSDATGAFRAEGLGAGELALKIESEQHGKADAKLHAVAGETVRWDAVLAQGLQLRGRVLDVDGKPVVEAMVEVHLGWLAYDRTDEQGRFTLKNCPPGQELELLVHRKSTFPELRVPHVLPGPDELVLRLPKEAWVYIQGKIVGPDGKPLPNVHVSPSMQGAGSSPAETADAATGAFRYGPYPPGEYTLRLHADGYPSIRLPYRKLAPDEVWDLGTLQFERGGTLLVNFVATDAGGKLHERLSILGPAGEGVDHLAVQGSTGRSPPLRPGSYLLAIAGDGVACAVQPFDVCAGVETRLDLPLRGGARVDLEFPLPAGTGRGDVVQVVVADAAGALVLRGDAWSREGPAKLSITLAPGSYRVTATRDALGGAGSIEVPPAAAAPLALSVPLAPK